MQENKVRYSKCPHCKQHGIPAFRKISYKYNPVVTCIRCGKRYAVNRALSVMGEIGIAALSGTAALLTKTHMPFWPWIIAALVAVCLFEYFAPLEDAED
jgi:hypothetical protein